MSPERWQQIEEIFQDALDLPWSEREKFVAEKCVDDAELKSEVEKLLSQFEDASSFIETPALSDEKAGVLSSLMEFDEDDPMIGNILGTYRIEREIGRGGMGAVYEAVRADGEFRRKVAIKVVKRGMDTDFILRRFRNERQILATLEHPYITRLLDGGTTDDGRPYFVMDYIEGLPLYRYSDKKRLTIDERLKLFIKICEAVEYAHQNLVIHRDLKPSNILVSADGTPRLLDFGIAKLLNPELASDTLQPTATAMRMMTIDYASPEQINGEKVTFSTDIYSLGVILFELLTGHRPYRFANRTPHEVARVICEEQPILPSDAITRSAETLPIIHVDQEALTIRHLADLRKNSPEKLREILRGNLDNITLKALCKLPDERYQSVTKFREDIEKYLDGIHISTPFYFPINKIETIQSLANTKLIAVLPLKLLNFSATENTDENYLSIGLADAIISRLTNVRDFTVRPTSSISGYEKSDIDPLQAGRELGVDFVLDGRIKKYGETLRISLQMLDVNKGSTAWAGQFDEKFSDVLTLEDAISEQVADALVSQVTGENKVQLAKRGTDNPNAYEAYLKGRYHWNQFTADSLPKAIEWFQKAVELDPNYALAYVGIADFYVWANIYGLMPPLEADKLAVEAIQKALKIDDRLGEAHATLGLIESNHFEWGKALKTSEKAVELSPNYPHAHEWYAARLVGSGDFAEGVKAIERAEELDPLSLRTKTLVAWTKYQAGQLSDALAKSNEIINLDAKYPQGHLQKGYILTEIGDAEEAAAEIEKGMELMPGSALVKYYYCFALASANRREDARKVWLEMKNSTDYVKPMFLGLASVAVGEIDEAFVWLNRAADEFDPWLNWLGTDRKLEPIRQDKRYLELLKRTKNPLLKRFEEKAFSAAKPLIAVLPLQFIGETQADEAFLSVGLTDAMITRLSQIRRIVVRPTNSVLRFADTQDSFAAGRELGVDYVLCGTIRPAGKRMRISAQLLEIKTNTTIWSDKFDEEFNEVLELEDKVAEKVAKLLIPQLTAEEEQNLARRNAQNVEAFEAYLRGRYHLYSFTPDNFVKAISYFEKAVEIDPNYALAYVALSDVHFTLAGFASLSPAECFPVIEKMAHKAVRLDGKLGDAYCNLGMVRYYNFDFERGEKLLKRGLELSPNQLNGYIWYSVFLTMKGKREEAVSLSRKAYEIDPISGFHQYHYIWVLYHNRHLAEAVELIKKGDQSVPDFAHGQAVAGWVFRYLDNLPEAVKHSEKAFQISPETPWIAANLAATYAKTGEKKKALELLEKIESDRTKYVSPFCLAQVYLHLGDNEKTLELLEKSVADKDVWFPWITSDPQLNSLRDEPRFIKLIERIKGSETEKIEALNTRSEKTIAVLPFQFIGEIETGDVYLAVGLADAMITRLSNVRRLIVRPTNSVLRFAETKDSFAAGRELGVDYVLNGTMRSAGNRLRISAQLLDTKTNKTLWTEKFDEEFTDVLELEDAVSEKVANALLPQLTDDEKADLGKRLTDNKKAYEAYIRGRYYWNRFTVEDLQKSLLAYQKALQHDPDFALAYAGIADFYNFISIFGAKSPHLSFPAAKEAAKKAIELDPNLGEAYIALGVVTLGYDWDFREAERLLMKGLYLNPNYAVGHYWYAQLLSLNGEHNNAIQEMELAEKLSPGIPSLIVYHAFTLRNARKFDQSLEKIRQTLAIEPNYYVGIQAFCWTVKWTKNYDEAEELARQSVEQTNRLSLLLYAYGYILAAQGKTEEARKIAAELEARFAENYIPAVYLSLIYTELGEFDLAFEWLEKSFAEREFWAIWLPVDPRFDTLKSDKRYTEFCRRIKPLVEIEDTIHQSQVPTKTYTAEELKGTKPAEKEVTVEKKPTFFHRHRFKFVAAAVLSLLISIAYATGILTIDLQDRRFELEAKNSANIRRSVAILPFKNETANPENDFLCDGLSDNLISRLQEVSEVQVSPRSASFKYKTGEIAPQKAGEEMQVEMILVGKLTEKSEKIEVSAELIDVKSGKALWGFRYGRPASELVDLQNQLANEVSAKLKINPQKSAVSKSYTESSEAFEMYLKGEYHRQKATPEDTRKSIEFYRKALELDPNYALAYQGLALAYRLAPAYGTHTPNEAYPLAKEAALKALTIDPSLGSAHIPLASLKFVWDWDFAGAESEYKQAIQLVPSNSEAHYSYGNFLVAMGRTDEALKELRIAQQFEPLSPTIASNIGWALYIAGRFDEAEAQIKQVLAREPNFARGYTALGEIYQEQGKFDESIAAFQKARQLSADPISEMALGHVYAVAGRKEEALKIAKELEEKGMKKEVSPFLPAVVYAGLNDKDKAFYWLERAFQERSNWLTLAKVGHRLKSLHGDPRFDDLLKRIGFDK